MRRYSEAVKADVRRRMSPPHRQSVARISEELGIHVITPLQMEEGLAVARRGGAGIRERP
jgi:hypothetical protein